MYSHDVAVLSILTLSDSAPALKPPAPTTPLCTFLTPYLDHRAQYSQISLTTSPTWRYQHSTLSHISKLSCTQAPPLSSCRYSLTLLPESNLQHLECPYADHVLPGAHHTTLHPLALSRWLIHNIQRANTQTPSSTTSPSSTNYRPVPGASHPSYCSYE